MREILFRGRPKTGEDYFFFSENWRDNCKDGFVYGSLVVSSGRYYICVSAICSAKCCVNNGITSMVEVIPKSIGQYTGLTDKNGKKIFEGDIFAHPNNKKYKYVVNWIDDVASFSWFNGDGMGFDNKEIEIIGNIRDNLELLKNGKEVCNAK